MGKRKGSRPRKSATYRADMLAPATENAGARRLTPSDRRLEESGKEAIAQLQPSHLFVDFLTGRSVLTAFIVMELVIIVALFPRFYIYRLNRAVEKASPAGNYEKAYASPHKLYSVFGRDPRVKPNWLLAAWDKYYWHGDPSLYARLHTAGAFYLASQNKYDEAKKLLDAYDPAGKGSIGLRGLIGYETGHRDEALKYFTQALSSKAEAGSIMAKFYVGRDLFEKGHYFEAALYLRDCIENKKFGDPAKGMMAAIQKTFAENANTITNGAATAASGAVTAASGAATAANVAATAANGSLTSGPLFGPMSVSAVKTTGGTPPAPGKSKDGSAPKP